MIPRRSRAARLALVLLAAPGGCRPNSRHARSSAVGGLRSLELCPECADGGPCASANQQPDHFAPEPGAESDQSGPQPGQPAVFVAGADPAVDPANAAASRPGAEIAYNIQAINQAFQQKYSTASMSASDAQLVANAQARWQNTVGGLQDAMHVQATVVGNLDTNRTQMSALVGSSQSATGALQATQAGNQLLALQAQQLADLTAVVAANGRAQALQSSGASSQPPRKGRPNARRFLTPGTGYQPGSAQMFYSGN